ncbi:hypothetical protein IEQ44_15050 [Nocardioides sp. Y6]|uniref:PH domain-containing protein n=1 Tax=Nocardioides malaquae TaxID=2773426 RepID=A0ABR9RXS0_9ACTN|nr:hypothetical protein [Nocardioides malaquae]MBE7325965.1 hypothetical protein [Nocardioides malaquae]
MTTAPDGARYSVTRRWMPWRRRAKDLDAGPDFPGGDFGSGDDLLGVLVLVVLVLLLVPFVAAAFLVALELLLLLLLLPFYVVARTLFGVSWEIEVRLRTGLVWPVVHTEKVHGWGASGRRINDLATAIRDGAVTMPIAPPVVDATD